MISEEDVIAVQPARINYHQLSKAAVYLPSAGSQADGCLDGRCGGSHSNHHPVQLLLTSLSLSLLGNKAKARRQGADIRSDLRLPAPAGLPFSLQQFSDFTSCVFTSWIVSKIQSQGKMPWASDFPAAAAHIMGGCTGDFYSLLGAGSPSASPEPGKLLSWTHLECYMAHEGILGLTQPRGWM